MILEGGSKGLTEEFILKLFKAIHQESISHQEKILNSK
jgi:chorismate mutase